MQKVILHLIILILVMGISPLSINAKLPEKNSPQAPGYYRAKLGAFEVVALCDGTEPRHFDKMLSNPELVLAEYAADGEIQPVEMSINAYLINTGKHIVLVDTGCGELLGPMDGQLIANLKAAGYRPDQIDTILLTHIHVDHFGGLVIGGVRQFPNATVYADGRDIDFFVTSHDVVTDSQALQNTKKHAREIVGAYLKAKRLVRIQPDIEVIPGITPHSHIGHTPGHTGFLVESDGHQLGLWGDIVHSAEIQFEHPEVTTIFDVNPTEAAQTCKEVLEMVATKDLLVGSAHMSFPGFGHVRKLESGYRWIPMQYHARVAELDPKQ